MTSVTVDAALRNSLVADDKLVEVKDAAGEVIGFFAPVALPGSARYAAAAAHFYPFKDLPRRTEGGSTYTTPEVLAHLKSLEPK